MFKLIDDMFTLIVTMFGYLLTLLFFIVISGVAYHYFPTITLWVGGGLAVLFALGGLAYLIETVFKIDLNKKMENTDTNQIQTFKNSFLNGLNKARKKAQNRPLF